MAADQAPVDRRSHATRILAGLTAALGSLPVIILSALMVVGWFVGGFLIPDGFGNDSYQLWLQTATSVITFVMVFVIQNTQNREGRAMQTKLDAQSKLLDVIAEKLGVEAEIVLTELVGVEDAPDGAIKRSQRQVRQVAFKTR